MIFVGDLWVQVRVSLGMKERTPAQRGAWWAEGCLVSDRSRRKVSKNHTLVGKEEGGNGARNGGGGDRKSRGRQSRTCLDMMILAIDTGTSDWYTCGP